MYSSENVPHDLPIDAWLEQAKADPKTYRDRQVTHVLLAAIGLTPDLQDALVLKGGTLMMLAFGSPRGTQDVDFTVLADPEPFAKDFAEKLDPALIVAASRLGYVDLVCRVQRLRRLPRPETFEGAIGPALSVTIGHAKRGTSDEERLNQKQSTNALRCDFSFREPITHAMEARLSRPDVTIRAYTFEDVIGEKLRALLQQTIRDRKRRQDVYDISWLLKVHEPDDESKKRIFQALTEKSEARSVEFNVDSFDDPEIKERAGSEWESLRLEVHELPDFDRLFEEVRQLYRSLPWPK